MSTCKILSYKYLPYGESVLPTGILVPGFLLGFGLDLGLFSPRGPDQGVSQADLGLETRFALLRQIIVNAQMWKFESLEHR